MKCAIYCRLSKEDGSDHESESIQNQKSLLLKYALDRDWEIFNIYSDEDYSGISSKRPAFSQLINDAESKRFDIVLCKTQSRFTRDMEQVEKYIHKLFPLWGIRFIAVADNADTAVKGNKKARQIAGLVNEWYLEDLSENIRSVLDHKRRQGLFIGSFPLYGYAKSSEKGRLVPDPEAADIVRRIYTLYLSGNSIYAICRILSNENIPNPATYKAQKGEAFRPSTGKSFSSKWNKTTVSRILTNEMYTGVMIQGRRRKPSYKSDYIASVSRDEWFIVENTHEAIIAPDIFSAVQEMIQSKRQ
ncbi:MAG: recombinase family protein [Oscillospiraceae bacterium]|nr:recombinase family protein [Oscillospiraceae bacterium]